MSHSKKRSSCADRTAASVPNRSGTSQNAVRDATVKKKIIKQAVMCLLSFALVFCSVFALYSSTAWFSSNKEVSGNGMSIAIQAPEAITVNVYERKDGQWIEITDKIDLSLVQPNECRRYLVTSGKLNADGTTIGSVTGTFDSVRFELSCSGTLEEGAHVGATNGEDNLFAYFFARAAVFPTGGSGVDGGWLSYTDTTDGVDADGKTGAVKSFYEKGGLSEAADKSVVAVTYPALPVAESGAGSEVNAQIVDLYFSKNLCRHFSDWTFSGILTVNTRSITSSEGN